MLRPMLAGLLLCGCSAAADLWTGLTPGRFGVGFRVQRTVDPTRNTNPAIRGTPLGMAIWYPAEASAAPPPAITQLDYRLLAFSEAPTDAVRRAFRDAEAGMMVAWRRVGIVPLTLDQARAALDAVGRAVRDAAPARGKFPVVVVLGGPFYLSTTAEFLASHGYLVMAPFRFRDEANEIPSLGFTWYLENSVRDAEWALAELSRDAAADTTQVAALGHGGGGLQALLLAMRSRAIGLLANIDAGNFSARSNPRQIAFYHPRLLRAPYLFIATADTRKGLDQFADFENMRFSRRYEVILPDPALRHHDLSDIGRGVTAALALRGDAQSAVLKQYADVQQMLLRFLNSRGGSPCSYPEYTMSSRDAVEPAPTPVEVLRNLDAFPVERLTAIHRVDSDAPLFSEDEMQNLVAVARTAQLARFALQLHPGSLPVQELASAVLESAGDPAAREIAQRCAAAPPPANDWRSTAAQAACRERVQRLAR
jgi:hypothetical protein